MIRGWPILSGCDLKQLVYKEIARPAPMIPIGTRAALIGLPARFESDGN